jgi:hypothetical protein
VSHRLSLSRYALALECSYWARPELTWQEKPPGEPARVGNLIHRFAELHGKRLALEHKDFDEANVHELAKARATFDGPLRGWVEAWRDAPVPSAFELRIRYDARTDTVSEAPRRGEPGYTRPGPSEVTGELDFVANHGDSVDVVDLKSGSPRHVHEEQLRGYALLASRFYRVPRVRVAFLYALKTKLTMTPWVEMDEDALDAEAGRIGRTLRLIPSAEPVPGEHCNYRCPMTKGPCPYWVRQQEMELEAAGMFA